MPLIKLYIATSLDGFIARPDGSLDWLEGLPNPNKVDHCYGAFLQTIDTVVMGRSTYEAILGFGIEWPYKEFDSNVITSNPEYQVTTERTEVLEKINPITINHLRSNSQQNIWVIGGGKVITAFLNHDGIDEMILSVIPVVLGDGIRLFPDSPKESMFSLDDTTSFETGVVNLSYRRIQ